LKKIVTRPRAYTCKVQKKHRLFMTYYTIQYIIIILLKGHTRHYKRKVENRAFSVAWGRVRIIYYYIAIAFYTSINKT